MEMGMQNVRKMELIPPYNQELESLEVIVQLLDLFDIFIRVDGDQFTKSVVIT